MKARSRVIFMLCAVAALALTDRALGETPPAQVRLVADVSAVKAGELFTVGLHFTIRPGWHIYWSNPGPAGIATKVKWTLPEGAVAGELQFPVPIRFIQPGEIVGYGYESEVLLMAQIAPPANGAGGELPIAAEVSWLCCNDQTCVPGRSKLEIRLPVAESAQPAHRELFERWRARVPRPVDEAEAVAAVDPTMKPAGSDQVITGAVVRWAQDAPAKVEFYPGGHAALEVSDGQVERADGATRIEATVRAYAGQKQWPPVLHGVLAWETPDGDRRGVLIPMATPPLPADLIP